jgi:Dyp-type peroxidase family
VQTYFALARDQGPAPPGSPHEPLLDTAEIQGNSLVGFNKDYQAFLFFQIVDPAAAKQWIKAISFNVATVDETLGFRRLFRAMRLRRGFESKGLVATWTNVAFSYQGLLKLTSDAAMTEFASDAFRIGMDGRASLLGDEVDATGNPLNWVIGSASSRPDVLVIVASDSEPLLEKEVEQIKQASTALRLIFQQFAAALPGKLRGHEHFGFKDGISQPGIRGRVTNSARDYLTPRLIDPSDAAALTQSKPGQPLIWPGQFVIGAKYPHQSEADPVQAGLIVPSTPAWTENGSFVVVRRLKQDVAGFWKFLSSEADQLAASGAVPSATPERVGSLLIGRWPSGAPVMRSPDSDDPDLGQDDLVANHFEFSAPTPAIKLIPPAIDTFPLAPGDGLGVRCPFGAHIRKVNPRDGDTEIGGPAHTLPKRVLRRGIPFGPPHPNPLSGDDGVERGLMFVSYQSSIEDQFEFLAQNWANSDVNPHSFSGTGQTGSDVPAGIDPVIGQKPGAGPQPFTIKRTDGTFEFISLPKCFVTSTGGGYFFSPSIAALRNVLSAPIFHK